jgi:uncharacterized protein
VLKLVVAEDESDALAARLDTRGADTPVIASILLYTEAHRVAHREDISSELVDDVLARISLVSAPDEIFVRAASFTGHMRSHDALHVATALDLGASEFITYDQQQARAAGSVGLLVTSPGR